MSLVVTKLNHIRHERIRGSLGVNEPITKKIKQETVSWFKSIHAKEDPHVTKQVMQLNMPPLKRRGRPRHTWMRQYIDQ